MNDEFTFNVGIITVSDKGSRGERTDESGPVIEELLKPAGGIIKKYIIVPDEKEEIKKAMIEMSDMMKLDVVLTSGGTGFSPRDVTPEATLEVIEKNVPGIPEAMRAESLKITPKAMLSRAVAGIRNRTLIINLPGSPKGVRESLNVILPALKHGIEILRGEASECAKDTVS
ncbi:MAG TPA: MogA/MoaB family molybdenum cofactor biosynthesis protein [Clostridiales bacterium]|nr:MogA/MoaB family molybdenum cofactor biosynthesis protein [Clostridiales bacterium]